MDERCVRSRCILGLHHGGQHLVIDGDQLSRVARQFLRRGDYHCDALADVAHTVNRERRPLRAMPFGAAHPQA
jgi:hypothetical protein